MKPTPEQLEHWRKMQALINLTHPIKRKPIIIMVQTPCNNGQKLEAGK